MKPKDLKHFYSWEERKPQIADRIFAIPEYYFAHEQFEFPPWETLFGNQNPVHIEFCAGNGLWILENAKAHPEINWVAVEMRFDRVRKIWSKMKNEKISNVFIVYGEAYTFCHHYVKTSSIASIYINFPDPWPKGRHEKHRLMKPRFVAEMGRILEDAGTVCFVTDDSSYLEETREHFLASQALKPLHPHPHFVTEKESYGTSYFDNLWREMGRTIHFLEFEKLTCM